MKPFPITIKRSVVDPEYATVYYNRGNAKSQLEHPEAAISDYDAAIRLNSEDVSAYNNRGVAKSRLGKYFEAISDYDEAIRLNPEDAYAYNNRGFAKSQLGYPEAAILIMMKRSVLTRNMRMPTTTEKTRKENLENARKKLR